MDGIYVSCLASGVFSVRQRKSKIGGQVLQLISMSRKIWQLVLLSLCLMFFNKMFHCLETLIADLMFHFAGVF